MNKFIYLLLHNYEGLLSTKFRQITRPRFATWKKLGSRLLFGYEYWAQSGGKNQVTSKRTLLATENIEMMVYVKENLPKVYLKMKKMVNEDTSCYSVVWSFYLFFSII